MLGGRVEYGKSKLLKEQKFWKKSGPRTELLENRAPAKESEWLLGNTRIEVKVPNHHNSP